MMVEAKKLGDDLRDRARTQGIQYCIEKGTKHFAVTDGQRWEIYETHRPVPIDEKRVVAFDLKSQSPAAECLKALALWRPSVEEGHVGAAREPVVETIQDQPSPTEPFISTPQPTIPKPGEYEWQSLTEVTATKGQSPVEVLLPDGRAIQVKNWGATLEQAVRWLTDKGILQSGHCPIVGSNPRAFRYMVHTQPIHSNGGRFKYPTEVNGLWVEKHDNHHALITKTKTIIKHVGQDPAQFKVRLS